MELSTLLKHVGLMSLLLMLSGLVSIQWRETNLGVKKTKQNKETPLACVWTFVGQVLSRGRMTDVIEAYTLLHSMFTEAHSLHNS